MQNTTAALGKVRDNPGGIGYATASQVCHQLSVKSIAIAKANINFIAPCNGKEVNKPVFENGSHSITRSLFVIIIRDGTPDEQAGIMYANFLLTDEGQRLIERSEFVSLR
jgi:phosphate transport system substrate-binding protein